MISNERIFNGLLKLESHSPCLTCPLVDSLNIGQKILSNDRVTVIYLDLVTFGLATLDLNLLGPLNRLNVVHPFPSLGKSVKVAFANIQIDSQPVLTPSALREQKLHSDYNKCCTPSNSVFHPRIANKLLVRTYRQPFELSECFIAFLSFQYLVTYQL